MKRKSNNERTCLEILVIYIVDLMKLRPITLTMKDGSQVSFMDRRMTVFDYQNRRADYVNAVLDKLINWDFAAANLL